MQIIKKNGKELLNKYSYSKLEKYFLHVEIGRNGIVTLVIFHVNKIKNFT